MARYRSRMQPVAMSRGISIIPDDVLAQIFLSDQTLWKKSTRFFDQPDSMRLRLVCKRFHNVFDQQPALWAYVSGYMKSNEIAERLRRSGAAGLTIFMDAQYTRSDFKGLVDLILPHSQRWQEVQFDFRHRPHDKSHRQYYEKLMGLSLPRLRRFVLRKPIKEGSADSIYSSWTMPKLVQLSCEDEVPSLVSSTLEECRLSLSGSGTSSSPRLLPSLRKFISSSTSLTSLHLIFSFVATRRLEEAQTIILPQLQELHINISLMPTEDSGSMYDADRYAIPIYGFITAMETPSLRELVLTLNNERGWGYTTECLLNELVPKLEGIKSLQRFDFIHETSRLYFCGGVIGKIFTLLRHVEEVTLAGMRVPSFSLENISDELSTQATHSLRTVRLKNCSLLDGVLELLLVAFAREDLFPHFQNIVVSRCDDYSREELEGVFGWEYLAWEDR